MTCIQCGDKLAVWDSREISRGIIQRRRRCVKCGHNKITIELSIKTVNLLMEKAGLESKLKGTGEESC